MLKNVAASTIVLVVLVLFASLSTDTVLTSCSGPSCTEMGWGYSMGTFDRYAVTPDHVTDTGVRYDPSGMPISPDLIDRLTTEVETCMLLAFPDKTLPAKDVGLAYCQGPQLSIPIDRHGFVVKVANDWLFSCDRTEQLLPVLAGSPGCVAKGETPTDTCPCRWRAGIRCPNELIVTPSFFLYKDVLIRYAFHCSNPWASPAMAHCASPSTTPLSDGSDPKNGLQ